MLYFSIKNADARSSNDDSVEIDMFTNAYGRFLSNLLSIHFSTVSVEMKSTNKDVREEQKIKIRTEMLKNSEDVYCCTKTKLLAKRWS